jgi:hypothetical protein
MAAGAQLMVHSVGDGTARKVLDAIENAREKHPENKLPVQLAHAVFVHPDDIARMKKLNVIAEISPPMYFWGPVTTATIPALGQERISRAHSVKDMLDAGLLVTYGSDWPASAPTANPWRNLEGMLTRLHPDGEYTEYGPLGEGIDLRTALQIFTVNGAKAMGTEKITGTIEVGKYADMVVLDSNPFDLVESGKANQLSDLNATLTVFEGEVVFDRSAAIERHKVVQIEITNKAIEEAVDVADLEIFIEDDLRYGTESRHLHGMEAEISAGNVSAPTNVNKAFAALEADGYRFARPARQIQLPKVGSGFWIQWTVKDDITTLWAFDPSAGAVVEVLRVLE